MTCADAPPYDTASIAEQAFVFAYPLVLMECALRQASPANGTLPMVHANGTPDTLRMSAWLDLGSEPLVLSAPEMRGRYYVLWLRDAWSSVFASIGARTTGTGPRDFAILGPGRHGSPLPPGLTPIAAPTRIAHVGGCLEAGDGEGIASASDEDLPDGFRLAPLSRWRRASRSPARFAAPHDHVAAVEEVEQMDAAEFFSTAARLLDDNSPEPADRSGLAGLRAACPWERPTPALHNAHVAGVERGRAAIRAQAGSSHSEAVGRWRMSYGGGRYGTDYLRRAVDARAGPDAHPATDELDGVLDTDDEGRPLNGRDRYVLRFAHDAPPPVNAFWSLTTCPDPQLAGPRSCDWTGDLRGLALDRDGSLPIHIQHAPPAHQRRSNWLSAPPDRFSVVLRLYWPRDDALRRRWSPPPITRLGAAGGRDDLD